MVVTVPSYHVFTLPLAPLKDPLLRVLAPSDPWDPWDPWALFGVPTAAYKQRLIHSNYELQ